MVTGIRDKQSLNMDNIKIFILQRLLPHYRTGFFRKFIQKRPCSEIIYGQPFKTESLKNSTEISGDKFIFRKNFYFGNSGKIFISDIYTDLFKSRPDVVISVFNVGNLNIYILFLLRYFLKYKIILWSFGYDPVKGFNPEKNFADKLRLKLSEKADAVLFYWEKGKKEIESFTKNSGHFFVAPNTLDTDRQFSLKYKFDETGIENLKKELKVNEKFHFIYTGRLLKDKQVDLLLKAFKKLEEINPDCRLSIIGNGSEYNYLKKLSEDLKAVNIYFLGEILDEETAGKWIYISDAYVMPGRLGLSVVHSFCFGTPVISQKKNSHYHGEGIGYIKEGVNGFLASDGNVNEITEIMNRIISDKELSEKLKHNAFETAKNDCSVDKMLDGFDSAINYVMKN